MVEPANDLWRQVLVRAKVILTQPRWDLRSRERERSQGQREEGRRLPRTFNTTNAPACHSLGLVRFFRKVDEGNRNADGQNSKFKWGVTNLK